MGFERTSDRIVGCGKSTIDGFTIHREPIYFEIRGRIMLKGLMKKVFDIKPDIPFFTDQQIFKSINFTKSQKLNSKVIVDEHHMTIIEINQCLQRFSHNAWGFLYRINK